MSAKPNPPIVELLWTPRASAALAKIGSKTVQQRLFDKVNDLRDAADPEALGKPMQDELRGLRSLKWSRYRALYRVTRTTDPKTQKTVINIRVLVLMVGIRKEGDADDVYRVATKLHRRGEF